MNYLKKLGKTFLFGVKDNKTGFILLLIICCLLMTALSKLGIDSTTYVAESYRQQEDIANGMSALITGVNMTISFFSAFIIPMCMFSYQRSRRKCEFFNAMPIKRSQFFISYTLAGFAMFLVSTALMNAIFAIELAPFGLSRLAFSGYGDSLAMFFITYSLSIFSTMISNSVLTSMTIFGFLSGGVVVIIYMLGLMNEMVGGNVMQYISVFLDDILYIFTPSFVALDGIGTGEMWYADIVVLIFSALLYVASFLLHRARRSEATVGVVFTWLRYPFQYAVIILFSLGFSLMFGSMTTSMIWMLIGAVIGTVISFIVSNIVFEMSAKNAFHGVRHMLISMGAVIAVILVFAADVLVLFRDYPLSFTPEYATVEVSFYGSDYSINKQIEVTDAEALAKITDCLVNTRSAEDGSFRFFTVGSSSKVISIDENLTMNFFVVLYDNAEDPNGKNSRSATMYLYGDDGTGAYQFLSGLVSVAETDKEYYDYI